MFSPRRPIPRPPLAARHLAPLALALALAGPLALHPSAQAAGLPGPGVAWIQTGTDAEVDKAFAQARADRRPLLLYWGASWCPPCNQLKATLFNRQDFIERAKSFTAVHVDGDLAGAQKLGSRFKVRGYPTLILFSPDGQELTRLPGEVEADQVMAVLQLGLSGGRPVKALLADARAGKPLGANEWRSLAFYGWDTDEAQLAPEAERAGLLAQLAAAAPASEPAIGSRLLLKALAGSDDGRGLKPDDATRERVLKLLADPPAARAQADVLVNWAAPITKALAPQPGAARQRVAQAFEQALERLRQDPTLSRSDRTQALISQVELARLEIPDSERQPKLAPALIERVTQHAAQDDREIKDPHERQAVITSDAHLLGLAGQWKASDELLKGSLARSPAPYYLMSQLGGNAKKQGRTQDALQWYEKAWSTSQGPATRLQWGSGYLNALVELAPQDAARIERTASAIFSDAAKDPSAFHERSARSLQRVGERLRAWNAKGAHDATIKRLRVQLDGVCRQPDRQDASQRGACEQVAARLG